MDRYKKIIILTALLGTIFICWGFFYSQNDRHGINMPEICQVFPEKTSMVEDDVISYDFSFDLSERVTGCCLHFVTERQTVHVFQEEKLIHSLEKGTTIIGKIPGKVFHFIKLPPKEVNLRVEIQSYEANGKIPEPEFFLGDRHQIFRARIVEGLPEVMIYFLTFLVGIMFLLFWGMVRKDLKNSREIFYFAILLILVEMWFMQGSQLVELLANNHIALSYAGYILFLQIPIILFCFSVYYWDIQVKSWWENLFFAASILNLACCVCFHVTGIKEFKETIFLAHIFLLIAFVTMFAGMFSYLKKHGFDYKVKAAWLPSIIMLIFTILDLAAFYNNQLTQARTGGVANLFFVVCFSWSVIHDVSMQLKEGQENAIYRRLAVTDLLTGLYNRNAYETWEEEQEQLKENMAIAVFDLNNLKFYNDTYGHEVGDKYIQDAAAIISESCGKTGTCYRIGGDEFLTVWRGGLAADEASIQACMVKLDELQQAYNEHSEQISMKIAYGYAVADAGTIRMYDLAKQADQMMYSRKKQMKI